MDVFSNLQVAGECLLDVKRTKAFEKAIYNTVKEGDIVLDGGTGSGILSLFAAKAGAKKVYAVELAPDLFKMAQQNVKANKLEGKIECINADMKDIVIADKIDVFVCEMLDTGLIAEQQCQAVNNLHERGIITENTKIIPNKIYAYLELIRYDFEFYSFKMPFIIQARNFGVTSRIKKRFCSPFCYKTFDLTTITEESVDSHSNLSITSHGRPNAILLTSAIDLAGKKIFGTTDMNMPVVIPIDEFDVMRGETVDLSIKYQCGYGFDQVKINTRI